MKLPSARLLVASTAALAMGVGVPMVTMAGASAATSSASATAPGTSRVPAGSAASQVTSGGITSPVTGTFTNSAGTGAFKGAFTPTKFSVVNGVLDATGTLTGTLTSADGTSLGTVSKTETVPVDTTGAAAPLACNILHLVLGPLNLDLLGLVVTLNEVDLNITAVPGSLLGDLLCDISGLLNGGGTLSELSALLNELLGLL